MDLFIFNELIFCTFICLSSLLRNKKIILKTLNNVKNRRSAIISGKILFIFSVPL